MIQGLLAMLRDALAFIFNPEARQHSGHHYPNGGGGMSIREAKNRGLIQ